MDGPDSAFHIDDSDHTSARALPPTENINNINNLNTSDIIYL